MQKKPVVLAILDGVGVSFEHKGNAVFLAKPKNLKSISENYPGTLLAASGSEVGLSWGEMGSSEVGHTNIGAGLVMYQNLSRINNTIKDKSFFSLPAWARVVSHAKKHKSNIHLVGLLSNGGVHSSIEHCAAILKSIKEFDFSGKVFIHAILDGQDVPPRSALQFLDILQTDIKKIGLGEVASITGRYFAMDKNENWDRTKAAYDALAYGVGNEVRSAKDAVEESYAKDISDEFVSPTFVVNEGDKPAGVVRDGDAVIFFNFRADRMRQLTQSFVFKNFNKYSVKPMPNTLFVSLVSYGIGYPMLSALPMQRITEPLSKIISDAGLRQLHVAEKEKYAHVTYFFNGGSEDPLRGEERIIVPSKSVKSYDESPEMSALDILEKVISSIREDKYDFIVANFANGDMVGHTGNLKAGVASIKTIDECVGRLESEVLEVGGTLIITADHGNIEEMINLETGAVDKEHSTNPVPFWIVSSNYKASKEKLMFAKSPQGILADVAPTILELLNIPKSEDMTGGSLVSIQTRCPLY